MNNPFFNYSSDTGVPYIDSKASINKMIIAKVPLEGIDDDIEGMNVKSIFSTKVIVDDIRTQAQVHGFDISGLYDSDLPPYIEQQLLDEHAKFHNQASDIVRKFGHRLGIILLTLKTGLQENRDARSDWSDKEWDYYKNLKKIILVGGLANGYMGEQFRKYALEVFDMAGVAPYEVDIFNDAAYYGVLGCANKIQAKDSFNVLFDFGQTNVKRCIVEKSDGKIVSHKTFTTRPSWFMGDKCDDESDMTEEAKKLHNNILTIICDTYKTAIEDYPIGNEIVISIASYTYDGVLNDKRGGYAKLSLLCDNYKEYLEKDLKKMLDRDISVTLIHDGTAVALYFNEYKDAVCFSIGTAFGVGFPGMYESIGE